MKGKASPMRAAAPQRQRLLDEVRSRVRRLGLARRTEEAYVGWIRRFILANGKRHPRELGGPEVEAFLTALATEGNVAASTQNQALSALLFLYREVLGMDLPWLQNIQRAKQPARLSTVLSRDEVTRLLGHMDGVCFAIEICRARRGGLRGPSARWPGRPRWLAPRSGRAD